MRFCLWLDNDVAWAQATYEYRPILSAAVVASSDLFRRRDFAPRRKPAPAHCRLSRPVCVARPP